MTGLPLVRSPAWAARRWVSSALRPRVETISPRSRKASETVTASSSRPPGLLRRSMMKPFSLSPSLGRQVVDLALQAFGGLLVEGGDADIGDVVLLDARAHRTDADVVAHQRDVDRIVLALADDLQPDLGVDRAAHLLDGLVEGQTLHRFVVELGDDVVGHDAGLRRRRVVDRRDDLDQAVFHRDFDAEAAELAAGLHLHVAEALGVHVAGVRIEAGQHAADRGLDQLAVVGLLDIVAAHALEHVAEQIELAIGVGGCRTRARSHQHGARLRDEERESRTGGGAEKNYRSLAHHPRTFSPSFAAHHGPGSIGVPSLRNST